ncbi:MAG: right-handed parallel beta-helix repeat-containing protein [bacterium]
MSMKKWLYLGMVFLCFSSFGLFSAVQPQVAWARDIRVPKDYTSIQKAVDAAQQGDRIMVAEGTYKEQVRIKEGITLEGGWNKQFTQRDIEKYPAVIDGKGKEGWVVLGASNMVLDGFTIQNATQVKTEKEEYGSGIYCVSVQKAIIRNNTLRQNEPSGLYAGSSQLTVVSNHIAENIRAGIHLEKGSSLVIQSNIIERNKEAGISSQSKDAVQMEVFLNRVFQNGRSGIDCQNATGKVYNNIVYKNREAGIRGCIAPLAVINNTIVGNGQAGVVMDDQTKEISIKNNIIAYNIESGIMSAQRGYSYNLLFANAGTGDCDPNCLPCVRGQHAGYEDEESYQKIGQVIANPLFVDPNNHDYHLLPGSPAIDAGDKDPVYADKNFPPSLGLDRNDIGAYGGPYTVPEKRTGENHPPLAQAEISSPLYINDIVRMDAGKSQDPDGDALTYQWALLSVPSGSKAKISRPDGQKASFRADLSGKYTIGLQLIDRWGAKAETTLAAEVLKNHPPTAYAGEDLESVSVGDTIKLAGDVSSDDDHDPLTYQWQFVARPLMSKAQLSALTAVSPAFTVDQPGCYILQLIVNDGQIDSPADEILINTVYQAPDKIRHVPAQYPTIQSAVDAAKAGDTILVQAGTYRENVYIEKMLNLKGVGWPVIDGGSKPGNVDTVKFVSLGEQAGRIEGFVITGGGAGPLGHGLSSWDSAPTICNNQFVGNPNNGIGLHGRKLLTEKAEVFGNIVYGNKGGIGNGRGSCAHVHHNYVFHNKVFGIGCRGFSAPRIEHNHIFENSIGIGMREVSSPKVVGNYIYYNERGIAFSPVATVKASQAEDILIHNNLIFLNQENAIMITSFNLSRVVITNNTIDSNGGGESRRGGGIILGWPWPATYEAMVQNNIITNNKGIGILNYAGAEDLSEAAEGADLSQIRENSQRMGGVKLMLDRNNLWNNKKDYQGCQAGEGDFSKDPLFAAKSSLAWEKYFLSQAAAGQSQDSPCVNAGIGIAPTDAPDPALGTTRCDLQSDNGGPDTGFHYLPADCGQDLPALVKEKVEGKSK